MTHQEQFGRTFCFAVAGPPRSDYCGGMLKNCVVFHCLLQQVSTEDWREELSLSDSSPQRYDDIKDIAESSGMNHMKSTQLTKRVYTYTYTQGEGPKELSACPAKFFSVWNKLHRKIPKYFLLAVSMVFLIAVTYTSTVDQLH